MDVFSRARWWVSLTHRLRVIIITITSRSFAPLIVHGPSLQAMFLPTRTSLTRRLESKHFSLSRIISTWSLEVYVIVRFLDERDRGEAEVEFIQKPCFNWLITWLMYMQRKKLLSEEETFLFREKLFSVLTQPPDLILCFYQFWKD